MEEKEEYIPGETVVCLAEGLPTPEIFWTDENSGIVIENATFIITSAMTGQQKYTCAASNEIRGVIHVETKTLDFRVKTSSEHFTFIYSFNMRLELKCL